MVCHFRKIPPPFQSEAKPSTSLPKQSDIAGVPRFQEGADGKLKAPLTPGTGQGPGKPSPTPCARAGAGLQMHLQLSDSETNRGRQRLCETVNRVA